MKIRRVSSESARASCIRFLESRGAKNLYLYEGLAHRSERYVNLAFTEGGRILGAAHSKSGAHVHLFFDESVREPALREIRALLGRRLPVLESFFGERSSVEGILSACGEPALRLRVFAFMELRGSWFSPRDERGAQEGRPDAASALLPLQVRYEIEELGVEERLIDRERTMRSLEGRLARGEVTVLREGGDLVACASLNARFGRTCQIGSIYVRPEYRRRGLGEAVTAAHVRRMLERFDRVVLFVGEENAAARRIYERLGFRVNGELAHARLARP